MFLDDDACPRPGMADADRRRIRRSVRHRSRRSPVPRWEQAEPAWIPSEFYWVVGCSYRGLPDRSVPIRNPIGANMAFRRSVFDRIGGFSDGIGRVGRTPLGSRRPSSRSDATEQVGGRIVQVPDAVVDHLVPADRTSWSYFCAPMLGRGPLKGDRDAVRRPRHGPGGASEDMSPAHCRPASLAGSSISPGVTSAAWRAPLRSSPAS